MDYNILLPNSPKEGLILDIFNIGTYSTNPNITIEDLTPILDSFINVPKIAIEEMQAKILELFLSKMDPRDGSVTITNAVAITYLLCTASMYNLKGLTKILIAASNFDNTLRYITKNNIKVPLLALQVFKNSIHDEELFTLLKSRHTLDIIDTNSAQTVEEFLKFLEENAERGIYMANELSNLLEELDVEQE